MDGRKVNDEKNLIYLGDGRLKIRSRRDKEKDHKTKRSSSSGGVCHLSFYWNKSLVLWSSLPFLRSAFLSSCFNFGGAKPSRTITCIKMERFDMNKCGHLATNTFESSTFRLAAHFKIEAKEKLWATDCHAY